MGADRRVRHGTGLLHGTLDDITGGVRVTCEAEVWDCMEARHDLFGSRRVTGAAVNEVSADTLPTYDQTVRRRANHHAPRPWEVGAVRALDPALVTMARGSSLHLQRTNCTHWGVPWHGTDPHEIRITVVSDVFLRVNGQCSIQSSGLLLWQCIPTAVTPREVTLQRTQTGGEGH